MKFCRKRLICMYCICMKLRARYIARLELRWVDSELLGRQTAEFRFRDRYSHGPKKSVQSTERRINLAFCSKDFIALDHAISFNTQCQYRTSSCIWFSFS
jgi:hypothetical protein